MVKKEEERLNKLQHTKKGQTEVNCKTPETQREDRQIELLLQHMLTMSSVSVLDSSVSQDVPSALGSECRNTRGKRAARISSIVAQEVSGVCSLLVVIVELININWCLMERPSS